MSGLVMQYSQKNRDSKKVKQSTIERVLRRFYYRSGKGFELQIY
jgi:hypothetical protein